MSIDLQGTTMTFVASQHFTAAATGDNVSQVRDALETGKITTCIFDFSKTELIDSSGIGTLVTLAKEFSAVDAQLILKNLANDILTLFEDTGLDRIFTIERDAGMRKQNVKEFFENRGIDIKLTIKKETAGDAGLFIMSGVLNHPLGSSYFKQQLLLFLAQHKNIVLDFEELTFFDSLSISAILNMNNLLKGTGGSLRICCPNFIVKDLLNTLSIDLIIPVFDQREEALADWSNVNG